MKILISNNFSLRFSGKVFETIKKILCESQISIKSNEKIHRHGMINETNN
jgi:hypothetical protein